MSNLSDSSKKQEELNEEYEALLLMNQFDLKHVNMCVKISEDCNPNDFIHARLLSREQIDEVYKSYLRMLIATQDDRWENLIDMTLNHIRFEEGFTYAKAVYVL